MSEMNALAGTVSTWLVIASVAAAVLTLLGWTGSRMFRRRSAAIRHEIWLHVLLAVVILPALWLFAPKVLLPVLPVSEAPVIPIPARTESTPPIAPLSSEPSSTQGGHTGSGR